MPNLVSFVHPSILIRLTLFGQQPRAVYIHIICSFKSFMHHMSSHLLWRIPNNQVSGAFMPPMLARSPDDSAEKPAALPVPDLTLSSPAIDAACPAAPSATSSAVTDGGTVAQRLRQRQHHPGLEISAAISRYTRYIGFIGGVRYFFYRPKLIL